MGSVSQPRALLWSVRDIERATPQDRDRFLDFLRVASLGIVVLGHWFMAVIYENSRGVHVTNALLSLPQMKFATWVFQVMPVFFFVGGCVHARAAARVRSQGVTYSQFLRARTERLLLPTAVFIAVWVLVALLGYVLIADNEVLAIATETISQPLWFIGVYLALIALAVPMYRAHERFGSRVLLALAGGVIFVDALRFLSGMESIAVLNIAFVWLFVHQLGYHYADGSHSWLRRSSRAPWLMVVGAAALLPTLTLFLQWYPISMVGLPGERISNMAPPTVALMVQAIGLIGVVLLLKAPLSRALRVPRRWGAVVIANTVAMTTFLWHLTALVLGYILVSGVLSVKQPQVGSGWWWFTRPAWFAVLALLCVGLVCLFYPVERRTDMWRRSSSGVEAAARVWRSVISVCGVVAVLCGILGFALTGPASVHTGARSSVALLPLNAVESLLLLVVGWVLIRAALLTPRDTHTESQIATEQTRDRA